MAEIQWEKDVLLPQERKAAKRGGRWKFLIIGVVLLGAIAYLLFSSTLIGARYYVTVDDLLSDSSMVGKTVRVSGAVDGDPLFNQQTHELRFVVANIPNDNDAIRKQGGLAKVLYTAVNDPNATRLQVIAYDTDIPDLLQHEAQAIMSGKLQLVDGEYIFYAEEITLKCPTKYEEEVPNQVES
ncbi:MAG: cytochrome c maturation protein CcmE [Anaerolineae bacterium]|nr:cytochrome c maturation protein CcmE [Anaerolineae bacterium]